MVTTLLFWIILGTGSWQPGATMPPYELPDQHGQMHAFRSGTRWVVVCYEKRTGSLIRRWLALQSEDYLERYMVDFIVETSPMPAKVEHKIVMPRMRKFKHRVLIAKDLGMREEWPFKPGRITVIQLDGSRHIQAIYFAADSDSIAALVESGQ